MNLEPRVIRPNWTIENLVDDMTMLFSDHKARGFILGLSGTDSILAFVICARAMTKAGFGDRIIGIHYGDPSGSFCTTAFPWLKAQFPHASFIADNRFGPLNDGARWGDMLDRAVLSPIGGGYRAAAHRLWVIGTKNLTEETMGTYSNSAMLASAQPLLYLWKSEVLDLCEALEVPRSIISRSFIADCGCGDPDMDMLVMNPRLTDILLMQRTNNLSKHYVPRYDPGMVSAVDEAISRQIIAGAFKASIPHRPDPDSIKVRVAEAAE